MSVKIAKVKMVWLGMKENVRTKDGAEVKSYNAKMMDFESDIYDFWLPNTNHALLKSLSEIPPMSQVETSFEITAYQTKPQLKLSGAKVIG